MNLTFAAVGFGHGSIHHFAHHRGHVLAYAIAHDEGNDGLVRHVQRGVCIGCDFLTCSGHLDVLVRHERRFPVGM